MIRMLLAGGLAAIAGLLASATNEAAVVAKRSGPWTPEAAASTLYPDAQLRLVDHAGRAWMTTFSTPEGASSTPHLVFFDGTSTRIPGAGLNGHVDRLFADPLSGGVIAQGRFDRTGAQTMRGLARWDGVSWTELAGGIPPDALVKAVAIDPVTGDLYVAGRFTTHAGVRVDGISRWSRGSGQWTSLPAAPFEPDLIAWDVDAAALVAAENLFDGLSVLVGGAWVTPQLQNGDTVSIPDIDDFVSVPGQGIYVVVRTRAFGPPSTFPGENLFRLQGAVIIPESRFRGFFASVAWDRSTNALVVCCGHASGMPDRYLPLRVTTSAVTVLPDLYPGIQAWEAVRWGAGGGRTVALYGRSDALELAVLSAQGWVSVANSVSPAQGEPTWNASSQELFVRAAGMPDVAVRSGTRWAAVPLPDGASADVVRDAGVDGTVIAGSMSSDALFVGRWRNGEWVELIESPNGFASVFGLNDAVWDPTRRRYVLAGNLAVRDAGTYRNYHLAEVDTTGWRPIDVGTPADGQYGRVFDLEVDGCPGGILALGAITQWGGLEASAAGCLVGREARAYAKLPEAVAYATTAGREPGVRFFSLPGGVLRRDAEGDRYVGRPSGSAGVVRRLMMDQQTGALIAVGSFLAMDGVQANSIARLTRFGWVGLPGLVPHAEPTATWIESDRRLVAGSISGARIVNGLSTALAGTRVNLPPELTSPGNLSGEPFVQRLLRHGAAIATDGDGDAVRIDVQWLRDGAPIVGAVGPEYRVTRFDRERRISAEVTATDGEEVDRQRTGSILIPNRPPSGGSAAATVMEGEGMTLSLATFSPALSDPDGDPVDIVASALPGGWRMERVDPLTLALFPPIGFNGPTRLVLSACDDLLACTDVALDVTVSPRLLARPDRRTLSWGARPSIIDVLENDLFVPSRLVGGRLSIAGVTGPGVASVDTRGTSSDASDDRIVFEGVTEPGESRVRYRLCEAGEQRCSEAEAVLVADAFEGAPVVISTPRDRGHHDFRLHSLTGRGGLRFETSGWAGQQVRTLPMPLDVSPSNPWNDGGTIPFSQSASVGPGGAVHVQARLSATAGADVDLYMGIDTNRDGRASVDEIGCASLSRSGADVCTLRATGLAVSSVRYWIVVHGVSGRGDFRLETVDLSVTSTPNALAATAAAAAEASGELEVRAIWNDPTLLPGETREGLIVLRDGDGRRLGETVVKVQRSTGDATPYAMLPFESYRFALAPEGTLEQLYIDVPPGIQRLSVDIETQSNVALRAAALPVLVPSAAVPTVARAPASTPDQPRVTVGSGLATLEVDRPAPGRWFIVPANRSPIRSEIVLRPRFTAAALAPVRWGGYFNPSRAGSGILVYPAGNDAAALWYTYDDSGQPTWYYLQGPRTTVAYGWSGRLYRSAWFGSTNRLVDVGRASLMPDGTGGVTFSYSIDGTSGSEALAFFGGGCPTFGGAPLNVSGHWFNPARAGSGFSVQMFPNYEFYLLFVYDQRGLPRFLVAEANGVGAASRDLVLQQTRGSCPLCAYAAPESRADVGRLRRLIENGALQQFDVQAGFARGLAGRWDVVDPVIPLAGASSLQGCPTP